MRLAKEPLDRDAAERKPMVLTLVVLFVTQGGRSRVKALRVTGHSLYPFS
jgi:hypothetical protein